MQVRARGGDIEVRRGRKKEKLQGMRSRSSRSCCGNIVPPPCPDCRHSRPARWDISPMMRCGSWKISANMPRRILPARLRADVLRPVAGVRSPAPPDSHHRRRRCVARESRQAYDRAAEDIAVLEKKLARACGRRTGTNPRPAKRNSKFTPGPAGNALSSRSSGPRSTSLPGTSFKSCFRSAWISRRRSRPLMCIARCARSILLLICIFCAWATRTFWALRPRCWCG